MKIGIFYIATSVYIQYFDRYFFKTMHNLFPEDEKDIIILTDNIHEEYASCNVKNCNIHFEKIIDFPYPILNLCKFQIIDEYAKKYNIDIVVFFDSDTIVFKKDIEFWNMLKQKCLDNKNTLIMSKHPYCFTNYINYCNNYFFPFRENSVSNITQEQLNSIKDKSYIIASFFMGYKDAVSEHAKKVHAMSHNNLVKLQWVPQYPEEYYTNVIHLRNDTAIDLDCYITINDGRGKSIWFNDLEDKQNIFINQKFDTSIKNAKKNQI